MSLLPMSLVSEMAGRTFFSTSSSAASLPGEIWKVSEKVKSFSRICVTAEAW